MINKILLIDIEEISSQKRSLVNQNWSHYPIGLMYLASSIKEVYPEIKIKIFHTCTSENPLIDLVSLLADFQPDLVGLRGLSVFKKDFSIIAQTVKKILPKKYVVAGGPYPSISYEEVLLNEHVDMVLLGEGEITFKKVVHFLQKDGVLPSNLCGTAILVNGCVVKNKERSLIADLDNIPFPDYDLIDCSQYTKTVNQTFISGDYVSMFTSRGCPFQCFYCHKLFGKKIRRRSPENIVAEMKYHYYKRNIKNFIFLDDVFNVPLDEAKQVLKMIDKNFSDIHLNFPNGLRADYVDDEFIDLLEDCRTVQVTLAIESANPRLQQYMGKNLNIDLAFKNIDKISSKFITTVMYMIGFPTETLSEAEETIVFAEQLRYVAQPVLNILRVYEDSPILNILNPSQEQMKLILNQSQLSHSERIFHDGKAIKPTFYGDYFSSELVPLKSKDIFKLNVKWIHKVINCKNRIRNSYMVMRRYINDDEILSFYKRFLSNNEFEFSDLMEMMHYET